MRRVALAVLLFATVGPAQAIEFRLPDGTKVSNWNPIFYVAAGVYLLGIVCWMFLDPVSPISQDEEPLPHLRSAA